MGSQECLLGRILGVGGIPQDPQRGRKHQAFVSLNRDTRPGQITLLPAADQHVVGDHLAGSGAREWLPKSAGVVVRLHAASASGLVLLSK